MNLLPLPVLDGGHILFAGIEKVTGKPIKAKTMEKMVIPFVVLLVDLLHLFYLPGPQSNSGKVLLILW